MSHCCHSLVLRCLCSLLLGTGVALAFPTARYHTLCGVVGDRVGQTVTAEGANLLGFPSSKASGNFPTFSSYFTTFPAAIAANTKIFKYIGGDLVANNPLQIFSPNRERVDRDQAYLFSSEVVGNFDAPVQISQQLL